MPNAASRAATSPAAVVARVPLRWRWPLTIALLCAGLVYSFWCLKDRVRPWNDFAFIYAAGRCWLQGISPYDFDRWNAEWVAIRPPETEVSQPMPFMYPPQWAPVAGTLALLPWPAASRLWDALNVGAFLVTCGLCADLVPAWRAARFRRPEVWLGFAVASFNPGMHYAAWQSQMAIVPTLGIVGAFWAWRRRRTAWLAIFTFVACLKPQLGLLPLFFLVLNGAYAGVVLGGAATAAVGLAALLSTHIERLPAELAHCYELHMRVKFNAPDQFFNLTALLSPFASGHTLMVLGPLIAVTAAVAATVYLRPVVVRDDDSLLTLSLVAALTCALMPIHGYDLALYTPIALLACERGASWLTIGALMLVQLAGRPAFLAGHHIRVPSAVLTAAVLAMVLAVAIEAIPRQQPVGLPAPDPPGV
jgi:hypothetical protein